MFLLDLMTSRRLVGPGVLLRRLSCGERQFDGDTVDESISRDGLLRAPQNRAGRLTSRAAQQRPGLRGEWCAQQMTYETDISASLAAHAQARIGRAVPTFARLSSALPCAGRGR